MASNYWKKFYKEKKAPTIPSSFARSVVDFFQNEIRDGKKELMIVDLGAGNGRDTKYLNKIFKAVGIDKNFGLEVKTPRWGEVMKGDLENLDLIESFDIIYSRFFLHSIGNDEIKTAIGLADNYFVAEFRIKGDKPVIYKNHKRNLVDLGWLINTLMDNNFEILKLEAGRGMAKYKNEDPLVARVYAKRVC